MIEIIGLIIVVTMKNVDEVMMIMTMTMMMMLMMMMMMMMTMMASPWLETSTWWREGTERQLSLS